MKRLLMATTALCLGAGMAAAQDMEMSMSSITVGGDGRMGVVFDDDENAKFSSRVRISFTAEAALDGGLTAGGSIRADNAPAGAKGTAGSVFLEGSFGKLAMGDVDPGAKAALGNVATVGYSLLDEENNLTYIRVDDPDPTLLYTPPKMGPVQAYASVSQETMGEGDGATNEVSFDTVSIGAKADLAFGGDAGTAWLGAGFEGATGDGDGHLMVGAGASVSGFTGKLLAGTSDDADQFAVSAGYSAGVIGADVFYADDTEMEGAEALGVGLEWSLGGGASIKTGVVSVIGQDGADDTRKADLGVTFSF